MRHRVLAAALSLGMLVSASASAQPHPAGCRAFIGGQPCLRYPRLAIAAELGVGAFVEGGPFGFGNGTGSATSAGPSWGARVGAEFLPWLAVDAHYLGLYNQGTIANDAGTVALLTNSALAELRLTLPLRYAQPYIFTGIGEFSTSLVGSAAARSRSPLHSASEPGVPFGLGLGISVTPAVTIGLEASFNFLIGESFSSTEEIEGGDPFVTNAVVRFRL